MRRCDILKNCGYLTVKFDKTQSISRILTYYLFARPKRLWLPYRWRECDQSSVSLWFEFWSKCTVQQLEVFFAMKECILTGHPNTGNDMVLDKSTDGITRSWNEILIIRIGDQHSFCTRNVVFCKKIYFKTQS